MAAQPDQAWVRRFRRALLAWYGRHRRDLPWRLDPPNAYATLVSEFMLQQTQVATVIPYFDRFMRRFPTVQSLARARIDSVLPYWAGLGYYRRCHHLHAAAKAIVREHGGRVPQDVEVLRSLPGVGAYTAGAVASIAFGVRAPAVDGNVRRVLARVIGATHFDTSGAQGGSTQQRLVALAERLVPAKRPGDFNQALMELGATVCSPRTPQCGSCPVRRLCAFGAARDDSALSSFVSMSGQPGSNNAAEIEGNHAVPPSLGSKRRCGDEGVRRRSRIGGRELAAAMRKPLGRDRSRDRLTRTNHRSVRSPRRLHLVSLAVRRAGRFLYVQRPVEGLWAGLWEWPTREVAAGETPRECAAKLARETTGTATPRVREISEIQHQLTHRAVTFHLHAVEVSRREVEIARPGEAPRGRWVALGDGSDLKLRAKPLPVSTAQCKIQALWLRHA